MALVVSNAAVETLLTMDECNTAMEEASRALGQGRAINRPRSHTYFPVPSALGGLLAKKELDAAPFGTTEFPKVPLTTSGSGSAT